MVSSKRSEKVYWLNPSKHSTFDLGQMVNLGESTTHQGPNDFEKDQDGWLSR